MYLSSVLTDVRRKLFRTPARPRVTARPSRRTVLGLDTFESRLVPASPVSTATSLIANDGSSNPYGDSFELDATVIAMTGAASPTGSVSFYSNDSSLQLLGTIPITSGNYSTAGPFHTSVITYTVGAGDALSYHVGAHSFRAVYTPAGSFSNSTGDGDLDVDPRAITVTADPQTKTYGDSDPTFTYSVTAGSLAGEDNLTGSLTRATGEDVGSYPINQGSVAVPGNPGDYALTYVGANLGITPRPVTVTADAQTKTYGDADPALTYSITSGSLTGEDAFSGALTRDAGENVGSYPINQGSLSLSSNYTLTFLGADLGVTPRPVTVTADAKAKYVGDADPALTCSITAGSLVGADALSGALTRVAGEAAGSYPIRQGGLTLGSNYSLTYVGADLTINVRPPLIQLGAATGGRTIGFWSNKNGQKLAADDLAALNGLVLLDKTGKDTNFTLTNDLSNWLLKADATYMGYMLSAQYAAAKLAVLNAADLGSTMSAATKYYVGDQTAGWAQTLKAAGLVDANGFVTLGAAFTKANTWLTTESVSKGSVGRADLEGLKSFFDAVNNNQLKIAV